MPKLIIDGRQFRRSISKRMSTIRSREGTHAYYEAAGNLRG
jgi:hypothetical protein